LGKPSEREGRKATGLQLLPDIGRAKIAGLPLEVYVCPLPSGQRAFRYYTDWKGVNSMGNDLGIRIRISADKMTAFVSLPKPPQLLEDQVDDGEHASPELTREAVLAVLEEKGVVFGIDPELVEKALNHLGQEIPVARGNPPQPGRDASIRCVFREKQQQREEEARQAEMVSFAGIISVAPGEVLGIRIPPEEGVPGTNVLGQPVPPPKPRDVVLKAGQGAEVEPDGSRVVATINGRPEQNGPLFAVYPVHVINGNVDHTIGHIRFRGDLVIKGGVAEGMTVEALGQVEVMGTVSHAVIYAGGDVKIHQNVLSSTIRAGGSVVLYKKVVEQSAEIGSLLQELLDAAYQLKENPVVGANPQLIQFGEGVLLKLLLEKKYTHVASALQSLVDLLDEIKAQSRSQEIVNLEGIMAVVVDAQKRMTGLGPVSFKKLGEMAEFIDRFRQESRRFADAVEAQENRKSSITVAYAQNSRLEASGMVRVMGKGAYYTEIYAGDTVTIDGRPGTFRNGSIRAGGDVKVRELGSPSEAATEVVVPGGKWIIADTVHPGTVLKAGPRAEKLKTLSYGVRYH